MKQNNNDCFKKKLKTIPDEVFVTLAGASVNVILAAVKFIFGIIGNSVALVADSIHSISDLGTDFVVLLGYKFWSAPPDDNHPYGHYKIEALITVLISVFLFLAAFGIVYNGIISLIHKNAAHPNFLAFIVALLSIVVKEFLFSWTNNIGKITGSIAIKANAWHHRTDAISSIPVAAAIGLSYAFPSLFFMDRVGAIFVSAIIFLISYRIMKEALSQLIDESIPNDELENIKNTVFSVEGVKDMHALRARKNGKYIFIDMHILVDGEMSVVDGHSVASKVKRVLKEKMQNIKDVVIHIEPFKEDSNG